MKYDAIVIGSGAGGGVAACVLAESGRKVLVIERGDWISRDPIVRDHVRNHRLALRGLNLGGLEDRRVFVDRDGSERVVGPLFWGFHLNAVGVGGATSVYGAQAWRFDPIDFRMASTYGVPEGSSLADWPFDREELDPWYHRVEWELGVCGTDPSLPMRPIKTGPRHERFLKAANSLGWKTQAVPLAINSEPRDGREACVGCQHCVGFACPTDAKAGSANTFLKRALATGNCTLLTNTQVTRLALSGGRVTEVVTPEATYTADLIILAAGAVETPRLLLASGGPNEHDQIGRNFQGHVYATATALFEDEIHDGVGPGPSISTLRFSHGNPDIIGGGMLANDFIMLPMTYAKRAMAPGSPTKGQAWMDAVRHGYPRTAQISGPIHEIPNPEARVTIDAGRSDANGVPLARLSGVVHPESLRAQAAMNKHAETWLWEMGAQKVWSVDSGFYLSGGQHQAGTCRMGEDPCCSVTDAHGRVHGVQNLVLADASVHVTNGGFNPFLTVMANAYRNVSAAAGV